MGIPSIWTVFVLGIMFSQGQAGMMTCGNQRVDEDTYICCDGNAHVKSWQRNTQCCGPSAYNDELETCCNGLLNPSFGDENRHSKCCVDFSYDERCYECKDDQITPLFNWKGEVCCNGKIHPLLDEKTCCCGEERFDPAKLVCCDNEIVKRPKDMPGDCCSCGLTKVDIVIVLDASESITALNWPKMLTFVTDILDEAEIDEDNVRVGLLTYRHNATVEFHLDEYHNKQRMFERVKSTPYIRGSTNTGMAIEMVRKDMFNVSNGDRPNVDNIALIITDGDSDDAHYSIEQAGLAKDSNIHVFAIGIALKNLTELKAIASPPAEENVLSIDDFEHLESLKGQIFASICTGKPIITTYLPCGDDYYFPGHEVCCNGKTQVAVAGDKTKCCDQKSYDEKLQICCSGVVDDYKGKGTVCCGNSSLDPVNELCCGKQSVPRPGKEYTECCGAYAYNPKTEICCQGYVSKAYGNPPKDTGCCEEISYDKRCWECVKGEILPLFDHNCQLCCDGNILPMEPGVSCCCGPEIFQPDKKICCNGELRNRKNEEKNSTCCECGSPFVDLAIVLDSSESVGSDNWDLLISFVETLIKGSKVDSGITRVALEVYRHNVTLEFTLNNYLRSANMLEHVKEVPYIRGSTNTGGALEHVRKNIFVPEAGDRHDVPNVAIVVSDGVSDDPDYTKEQARLLRNMGVHIYAIAIGLDDANEEVKDMASPPWQENVYSTRDFKDLQGLQNNLNNVISSVCPQEPKQQKCKEPCGELLYDPKTEVCCDGNPQPMQGGSFENTKCCWRKSYDFKEKMCCNGKINNIPAGNPECCDQEAYDPRDSVCCYESVVLPKTSQAAGECCGNSTYDPVKEICCEDDSVYQNYGDKGEAGACCVLGDFNRTVSYDTRCYECINGELVPRYDCTYQICCDGVIQEYCWDQVCCCGKIAFNPEDGICCEGNLKKRTAEDDKTCCECANDGIMDIVIVLDSSESVGIDNWRKMELFVEDLISDAKIPDARFGLLSYKHNVSVEFHLNTYFDKKALLGAVDNLPYVRGSTNTGMALEIMRKQMFTPRTGDRSNAPNSVILITDGMSDDPKYTKEQAEFARAQGIHIIALGVGLEDVKELQDVASPPVEDNAIALKDFKELEAIKKRIFNDVSKSSCAKKPKNKCGTPCGDTKIDLRVEICCNGSAQKRMAGENTQCCGQVAYDPECFICCEEDNLVSRYAGEATECCCKWAYDSRSHMCCGNQILPLVAGKFTECCHNETIDTRTQVCCDFTEVQSSYGKGNTDCCNGESFDTRCYQCKRGSIEPAYDVKTELCCDGEISEMEFGEKSCCCGKKQFNADIGICCEDNYFDRPKGDEVTCCGPNIHDAKKEICCDDNVQPRVNGFDTGCCLDKSFDPTKEHCCEGKINKKKSDKETCCCDDTVYDFDKMICCDGTLSKLTKGNRTSTVCCGNKAFDPLKQICCDGKINKLQKKKASTSCCNTKAYDPSKQVCVDGKVEKISNECGCRKYNPKTQTCCNGWINNATYAAPWSRCCFGEAYDARKEVCCCNGNLEKAIAGIFTQCCYSSAYDSRTHTCCDGQIVRKPYPSAECCCERAAYDSNREICCGGKVRACGGDKRKCCGTEAYDPMLEICCDGKLHDRRFGAETFCCGDEAYTPMLAVCCGERIAYRKKISLEW